MSSLRSRLDTATFSKRSEENVVKVGCTVLRSRPHRRGESRIRIDYVDERSSCRQDLPTTRAPPINNISGGDALRGNTRSHPEHDG